MRRLFGSLVVVVASVVSSAASADAPDQKDRVERATVDATVAKMRTRAQVVLELLRNARRHHRAQSQVACVSEALSRVDVALRRVKDVEADWLAANARGDFETARLARTRIVEWSEAQRLAARDGISCQAPPEVADIVTEGTIVRLAVDPSIPPRGAPGGRTACPEALAVTVSGACF